MMHTYNAEFDFALLYSLRNPELARMCANAAMTAARALQRGDLIERVDRLLELLSR